MFSHLVLHELDVTAGTTLQPASIARSLGTVSVSGAALLVNVASVNQVVPAIAGFPISVPITPYL